MCCRKVLKILWKILGKNLKKFWKLLEIRTERFLRKMNFGEITGTAGSVKIILHKSEKRILPEVFHVIFPTIFPKSVIKILCTFPKFISLNKKFSS